MHLMDYFDVAVAAYPRRLALTCDGVETSFVRLKELARRLANSLRYHSYMPGDKTAILSPDGPLVLICLLATLDSCGVWTPTQYHADDESNLSYLTFIKPKWLFYHSSREHLVKRLRERVRDLALVSIDDNAMATLSVPRLLAQESSSEEPARRLACRSDELIAIFQTGATTGAAKAVGCTTLNWIAAMETFKHYAPRCRNPVCLTITPLSHAAGTMAFTMLTQGAEVIALPRCVPSEVLEIIERRKVTHMFLVPSALYGIVEKAADAIHDYRSLKMMWVSGGTLSRSLLCKAVASFGPCLFYSYGQLEAPHIAWFDALSIARAIDSGETARLTSCGRPTYDTDINIVRHDGSDASTGERGEIVVRGPGVRSYYDRIGSGSREDQHGAWHRTGDIGHFDNDGFLYIDGRDNDRIKTTGLNIWASEIESKVRELKGVSECAIVGVPHEVLGERMVAVISRSLYSLDTRQVIMFCREELGQLKTPTEVEFWESMPLTPAGKIDKKEIRRRLQTRSGVAL